MWNYFQIELKQFFFNKKNIAIYCLLVCAVFFYAVKLAPDYTPIEQVDRDEIEARYITRQAFINHVSSKDLSNAHPLTLVSLNVFTVINPLDEARLKHLDEGDLTKYAAATSDWYFQTGYVNRSSDYFTFNPLYYTQNNRFANEDAFFVYIENAKRYEQFAVADYPLSIEMFEQKTAWQTLERLLKGALPTIFIFASVLLTVDIVTKDRQYRTVLQGLPIADWKKVLVKFAVAMLGSVGLFVPVLLGLVIIGMQSGFGHLQIPVPIYKSILTNKNGEMFEVMSLGSFLLQSGLMIVLWFAVIISIILLCSVIFKIEFLNLAVAIMIVFAENMYRNRGIGFFWHVEDYPTTYIQVGNIISGYQNYFYTTDQITVDKGLLLLGLASVVVISLTCFITLHKYYRILR